MDVWILNCYMDAYVVQKKHTFSVPEIHQFLTFFYHLNNYNNSVRPGLTITRGFDIRKT